MLESVVVAAINHLLRDAEWARQRLAKHGGRTARFESAWWTGQLAVTDEGLFALAGDRAGVDPDLVLELPGAALASAFDGREALIRAAMMRGNVEFAEALGFVLRHLRWDFEDDLSHLTGDVVARRIAATGDELLRSFADGIRRLGGTVSEYVIHEGGIAAAATVVADFCRAVDDLRDRQERLEARLRRLEQIGSGPSGVDAVDRPLGY